MTKKDKLKKAFFTSLPIAFGYVALGIMGGAMIQKVGFNPLQVVLFAVLVFSGSAVFISASMLASGVSLEISLYLIVTILITNLRNTMYSSSLINDVRDLKGVKKILFSLLVTDETFAIDKIMFEKDKNWDSQQALYLGYFACFFGMIGNLLGALFGEIIDIPVDLAFFMMTSMFVVLTVLRIKDNLDILMLFVAIIVSFIVLSIYQGGLDLIIIALIVTSIGYFLDKKHRIKGGINVE
ncbi:AzlC family ABC transporter permease [Peptostreptococcus equinus]|uniref:AzlC family ABC transporter permease n=1 Tax=Peptostreptococcus equinus TaxID=3003601 RepID=A0ABY7JSV8_9FIRM|nr:AzlC family ABC transporter permease [Peptostreptococcus sp. CBA3647]WAW15060.1 AzlC family ABC transporter permease [Peptostreptococcus sp. CBA3647]